MVRILPHFSFLKVFGQIGLGKLCRLLIKVFKVCIWAAFLYGNTWFFRFWKDCQFVGVSPGQYVCNMYQKIGWYIPCLF